MDAGPDVTKSITLDIDQIMARIPHRYPFLLIDRVIELIPDVSATAIKNVTINEPHFAGHFPARPVMPGVLIIEAMAQTSAALVVETLGLEEQGKIVYFMTIDKCRFRKPVTPGDQLYIHVEKARNRGPVWKFNGTAKVDDTLVAEAVISAMIVDE
jgi:3-hydroxyacyl-[acyl-carrier-protein] dehydratase